jgi:hypothetical protein
MTLTTSGAVTLRGSSSMPEDARCDRYLSSVAGGGTEVPLPTLSVNDYKDELTVNLEGWKGPGTYPLAKRLNEGTASYASVSLTVGSTKTYGTLEAGAKPATGSAVVRSDGSVTVTFKGLAAYGHASKTVSGTAKYSCQDI